MVHEHGPEVILPDPMLPDRSGDELCASLQRDPATLAIPVLFLPGEPPPVTAEEGDPQVGGLDILTRLSTGSVEANDLPLLRSVAYRGVGIVRGRR
jgi:CheY-like chemotaxis protein